MYIEPNTTGERRGSIEVICGSMFSGKTEELIRRLRRVKFANQQMQIFKPLIDTRYHELHIVSHDDTIIQSIPVRTSREMIEHATRIDVIGIDEAQFFDDGLPAVCEDFAMNGIRVIVAGLDMDYLGQPFGAMPALLAKADFITKLHAICPKCGYIANYSFRKTGDNNQVVIGEKEVYEPRCRKCFYKELNSRS